MFCVSLIESTDVVPFGLPPGCMQDVSDTKMLSGDRVIILGEELPFIDFFYFYAFFSSGLL